MVIDKILQTAFLKNKPAMTDKERKASDDYKEGFLSYLNKKFAYVERHKNYLNRRKALAMTLAAERYKKRNGKESAV